MAEEEEDEDEEEEEEEEEATGRLRMSFIPCGVAEEQSCGDPSPEDSPAEDDLIPGEDTAIPPGLGEVEAGEVEELGPVEQSG